MRLTSRRRVARYRSGPVITLVVATLASAACRTEHDAPRPAAHERREPPKRARGLGSSNVERIVDGDTLILGGERVRLAGIDTPETKNASAAELDAGRRAREALESLVTDEQVTLVPTDEGRDRFGRVLADVRTSDGRSLSEELLRRGFAKTYRKNNPNRARYEALEAEARRARRGLWAPDGEWPGARK
ncbi:thermonuclease family protein [Myxococcota bacterium]|nr:thermonuclease family protein [Myxococcota bacterium]